LALGDVDGEARLPRQLDALGLAKARFERLGDLVHAVHAGPDRMALFATLDVVGPGLDRGFHDLVLVPGAGRILDHAHPLEPVTDRAGRGHVAAVLGERGAHIRGGAVAVVGQRLDDQRHAAGAVALVADLLVVIAFAGRSLV